MSELQGITQRPSLDIRSYAIPEKLRHPWVSIRVFLMSEVFRISKEFYDQARPSLAYCNDATEESAARKGLYHTAVVSAHRIVKAEVVVSLFSTTGHIAAAIFIVLFSAELASVEDIRSALLKAMMGIVAAWGVSGTINDLVPWGYRIPARLMTSLTSFGVAILLDDPKLIGLGYMLTHQIHGSTATSAAYILMVASVFLLLLSSMRSISVLALAGLLEDADNKYTATELIGSLAYLLHRLVTYPAQIRDLAFKSELARDIEAAAVILQRKIPKTLALRDLSAKADFQDRCNSSATALRAVEVKIAVSGESALDDIKKTIAQYVIAIATGNYAMLPDADTPSLQERRRKLHFYVAKSLASAFAPIFLLTVARHFGLSLSGQYSNLAVGITLLWATFIIVSLIDPLFKSRLAEIQRVASTFRRKSD